MKTLILSDQQTAMQLRLTEYTVQNKITSTGGGGGVRGVNKEAST